MGPFFWGGGGEGGPVFDFFFSFLFFFSFCGSAWDVCFFFGDYLFFYFVGAESLGDWNRFSFWGKGDQSFGLLIWGDQCSILFFFNS
jgi:hypothetical protein